MAGDQDRDAQIRERAFHIWLEEGCPDGRADEHWRRATDEIDGETTPLHDLGVDSTPIMPPTH